MFYYMHELIAHLIQSAFSQFVLTMKWLKCMHISQCVPVIIEININISGIYQYD